jgi:hypothetical protein
MQGVVCTALAKHIAFDGCAWVPRRRLKLLRSGAALQGPCQGVASRLYLSRRWWTNRVNGHPNERNDWGSYARALQSHTGEPQLSAS